MMPRCGSTLRTMMVAMNGRLWSSAESAKVRALVYGEVNCALGGEE